MYLFSRLFQAARAWRHRRAVPRPPSVAQWTVEQLDHRQLLSVNFTGNVATDFPATESPGVVIFNSSNTPGIITPDTIILRKSRFHTSGFDISESGFPTIPPTTH